MKGVIEAKAFSAVVQGRVQGVGFRWTTVVEAKRLGLTGWVRNAVDGSVEVWAEGAGESLDAFLRWLRRGPPRARVDGIRFEWSAPRGFKRFSVE
jgi:acylphosphatase